MTAEIAGAWVFTLAYGTVVLFGISWCISRMREAKKAEKPFAIAEIAAAINMDVDESRGLLKFKGEHAWITTEFFWNRYRGDEAFRGWVKHRLARHRRHTP